MGNSYSPEWCPPGTLGYENQQNGQGKSDAEGVAQIGNAMAAGAAAGASVGAHNTVLIPVAMPTDQALISRIDGEFKGWTGETIYKLMDGHIIQQSVPTYSYSYAFNPEVAIYRGADGGYGMHVDGVTSQDVSVRFLQ
nr:hypothetical protein [uncultured Lichenicoccus sp.]